DNKLHAILKSPGVVKLAKTFVIEYAKKRRDITDFKYFLGHTQAPTSSERNFSPKTSHPFQYKNWIIAHNGVLTNDKLLKKTITDKKAFNAVDSSVIAPLIHNHVKQYDDEVVGISKTLSLLEGTFGLWMYNQQTANVYLARSGSTLYADFLNNEFSSLAQKEFIALEEGLIYLLTPEGITSVGKFKSNSPFFNK
ncbi:hypothetical protein EBR43_10465, partial [bacterium]|nr:hypothetical protein [bacterium]